MGAVKSFGAEICRDPLPWHPRNSRLRHTSHAAACDQLTKVHLERADRSSGSVTLPVSRYG